MTTYKIEDCFYHIQNGANIKQGVIDGGYPITRIETIANDRFNRDRMGYAGITDIEKYAQYILEDGDLLMSHINSVQYLGRTVMYNKENNECIIHGMNLLRLKANRKIIHPAYAKYYFYSPVFKEQLSRITKKSVNQASFAVKDLKKIEISCPSISEQINIVGVLNEVNIIIDQRQQELDMLDELVKARFVEMFGDCKNEVLIGDVISISRGASPRPISAFITDREDGVNWIKIGDVSENSLYIMKTEERITPEGAKKSRMVHKGDFILSNSMSFGRPYILGINGCVHDGWLIMSDFKETFNELYLYHAIRSDDVQYQFSGKVNGATVKNLNSDLVKKTFIKVPPMGLQNQFAAFVEQTDKSKVAVKKALDEAQLLFDSLMQEYFG